jgi:hypothetical protein
LPLHFHPLLARLSRARPLFGLTCCKVCRGIWCPWREECAWCDRLHKPLQIEAQQEQTTSELSSSAWRGSVGGPGAPPGPGWRLYQLIPRRSHSSLYRSTPEAWDTRESLYLPPFEITHVFDVRLLRRGVCHSQDEPACAAVDNDRARSTHNGRCSTAARRVSGPRRLLVGIEHAPPAPVEPRQDGNLGALLDVETCLPPGCAA